MLYNDIITYNQTNITYTGTVQINVPGISNPIILSDILVVVSTEPDYSNATTIGIVTYDFAPTGEIIIEATQDQAEAIVQAQVLLINSVSGEISIQTV